MDVELFLIVAVCINELGGDACYLGDVVEEGAANLVEALENIRRTSGKRRVGDAV